MALYRRRGERSRQLFTPVETERQVEPSGWKPGPKRVQERVLCLCGLRHGQPEPEDGAAQAFEKKGPHWHIDELRAVTEFRSALAIRSATRLECQIAEAFSKIADGSIRGFGCSDCQCGTHLFRMDADPLQSAAFHRLLQYFRMGRYRGGGSPLNGKDPDRVINNRSVSGERAIGSGGGLFLPRVSERRFFWQHSATVMVNSINGS